MVHDNILFFNNFNTDISCEMFTKIDTLVWRIMLYRLYIKFLQLREQNGVKVAEIIFTAR